MLPGPAEPKLIVRGLSSCDRDQLLHVGGRKGGLRIRHDGRSGQKADWLEVLRRVVRHRGMHCRICGVIADHDDERVTVGIRFRRRLRSIIVLAPGRVSMITGWRQFSVNFSPTTRARCRPIRQATMAHDLDRLLRDTCPSALPLYPPLAPRTAAAAPTATVRTM